jgi:hypothetical protein
MKFRKEDHHEFKEISDLLKASLNLIRKQHEDSRNKTPFQYEFI